MLKIEIDEHSGFCFGVTTAIKKAEEELQNGGTLYCLGDIVHNSIECTNDKTRPPLACGTQEFEQIIYPARQKRAGGKTCRRSRQIVSVLQSIHEQKKA